MSLDTECLPDTPTYQYGLQVFIIKQEPGKSPGKLGFQLRSSDDIKEPSAFSGPAPVLNLLTASARLLWLHSCPITLLCNSDSSFNNFSFSLSQHPETGIPVHLETMEAMSPDELLPDQRTLVLFISISL